ncbi:MAG: hypothetical protein JOZ62_08475 [Acidobacteriaceae bacterium]|nr:hypothetical protein [Acidobacteriaceae bacterium]
MQPERVIRHQHDTLTPEELERFKNLFEREGPFEHDDVVAELSRLREERASLTEQLKHIYDGTRMEVLPPNLYKAYGRIRQIDAEMERLQNTEKYRGWPERDRRAAEEARRILRLEEQAPERRERLEHLLDTERGHIKDTTNLSVPMPWRLAAETVAWRQGITRKEKEPQMLERERESWRDILSQRAHEISAGWRSVEVDTAMEAVAALNHWRGRAEEFNATREAIARQHPEIAKDLPAALEVDEIQVRQRVLERERSEEKSLAVAL